MIPQPGTYVARRSAAMVIEETEKGALILWIPYTILDLEQPYSGKHCYTLAAKDGTVQKKGVERLRKIWPDFDGIDFFGLEEIPLPEDENAPEFELQDCFHDDSFVPADSEDGQPIIQFKAKWLNPIGGSQNIPTPMDQAARKAVLTKWSSKFKALAGGSSAAKPVTKAVAPAPTPTKAVAKAAPTKAAAAGPPSRRGSPAVGNQARTMTGDEVWAAFDAANPDENADALGKRYYDAAEEIAPGKEANLTLAEWGKVADALGV